MAGGRVPVESYLNFIKPETGEPAPEAHDGVLIQASSRGLGWDGVIAEVGQSHDWQADELAFAGHFAIVNLDSRPLMMEVKGRRGHHKVSMAPGALGITPARAPFTHRNQGIARWGAVEVSPEKVRRVLGRQIEPRLGYGVVDEPLAAVVCALAVEVRGQGSTGPLFVDGLAIAFITRLAILSGVESTSIGAARALVPRRLEMVIERIEDLIRTSATIDELAAIAGLSPAHFAREFKRCTRETPHAFVTRRRLERARDALLDGRPIAETANSCGFYDQAHLSRLFKQRFGVTPGTFVR